MALLPSYMINERLIKDGFSFSWNLSNYEQGVNEVGRGVGAIP